MKLLAVSFNSHAGIWAIDRTGRHRDLSSRLVFAITLDGDPQQNVLWATAGDLGVVCIALMEEKRVREIVRRGRVEIAVDGFTLDGQFTKAAKSQAQADRERVYRFVVRHGQPIQPCDVSLALGMEPAYVSALLAGEDRLCRRVEGWSLNG